MDFAKGLIETIYRHISNNWYSVIINGARTSFFKSSRGLKQGDPLSPTLFIITAKILTKSLNQLIHREEFIGFSLKKNGPQVNHLGYADDLVPFFRVTGKPSKWS